MTQKNKITLYVGCGEEKKKVELYNFSKLEHYWIRGVSYIRILCGKTFYYYQTNITAISEIEIK